MNANVNLEIFFFQCFITFRLFSLFLMTLEGREKQKLNFIEISFMRCIHFRVQHSSVWQRMHVSVCVCVRCVH